MSPLTYTDMSTSVVIARLLSETSPAPGIQPADRVSGEGPSRSRRFRTVVEHAVTVEVERQPVPGLRVLERRHQFLDDGPVHHVADHVAFGVEHRQIVGRMLIDDDLKIIVERQEGTGVFRDGRVGQDLPHHRVVLGRGLHGAAAHADKPGAEHVRCLQGS
ncbi:MAG TPA: hypothetical protein DIU07_17835, partial [Rhodobacteraceae bacterium]|nr:hypothetical protein [Paracoccaceae bacterium]